MRVIAFANAHAHGRIENRRSISGGDRRFIEIFKRLSDVDKVIVAPRMGKELYEAEGLHATYVITTNEEEIQAGIRSIVLTYLWRIVQGTVVALFKVQPSDRGDVIYVMTDIITDTVPAFILKARYRKMRWVQLIYHLYDGPLKRTGNRFSANLLSYLSQRASLFLARTGADAVVVLNASVKTQLVQFGFNADRIQVASTGVDLERLDVVPDLERAYSCVFLGRLHASKGIFDLVEIWKAIRERRPGVTLAIIGGGHKQIEDELRHKIAQSNLENDIHVYGYMADSQAFALVRASKIFVSASHEEGFGMAILEAMACGLPTVAWDLEAYREAFPICLVRVKEGDVESFAEQVILLLENAAVYHARSAEARLCSARHSWDDVSRREQAIIIGQPLPTESSEVALS